VAAAVRGPGGGARRALGSMIVVRAGGSGGSDEGRSGLATGPLTWRAFWRSASRPSSICRRSRVVPVEGVLFGTVARLG